MSPDVTIKTCKNQTSIPTFALTPVKNHTHVPIVIIAQLILEALLVTEKLNMVMFPNTRDQKPNPPRLPLQSKLHDTIHTNQENVFQTSSPQPTTLEDRLLLQL
ncbi:hypothetical protein H0H93_010793 [Arthromyces matolae]|nr:hypothetical protein H0H93_010793 [Arthromyces matolae]